LPSNSYASTTTAESAPRRAIQCIAPARVNLLGEHTDYTGGLVLPMAIPFFTQATISPRDDGFYSFTSDLFPETLTLSRDDHSNARSNAQRQWTDYPVGVLRKLQEHGIEPPSFDLHLAGNVPFGAGVSSSASVEVASAMAMLALSSSQLSIEGIAVLCQRAENEYVESPCGIMDQFVITAARAGHALLLDTRSLTYEHLPMNKGSLAETQIVVCNSMVKHSVATGEYGMRRKESEEGQAVIIKKFGVRDLGDSTLQQLESAKSEMSDASFRRCRHIITDNARVREAKQAMFAGDPIAFGKLMLEGHISERDDFECSCEEVDFLVETATSLPGCFGARLTGGGFGGSTVSLVERSHAEAFLTALKAAYQKHFNITADAYVCDAVDGAMLRNASVKQVER
jgi:galactokinase